MNPTYPADFVKEVTNATADGDIILGVGPDLGYVAWGDAYWDGDRVSYAITDSAGNWETGTGTFSTGTPNSISRDFIWWSSNGGDVVDFTGITARVYAAPHAGGAALSVQAHFRGSAPSVSLDNTLNATWGSMYFGMPISGGFWYCIDGVTGAAKWFMVPSVPFTNNTKGHESANVLAGYFNVAGGAAGAVLFGENNTISGSATHVGAKGRYANALIGATENFGAAEASSPSLGQHQTITAPLALRTTTATLAAMLLGGGSYSLTPPNSSSWWVTADVVAWDTANNLSSAWQIKALVKRNGSAAPTIVGSSTATALYQDASASSWVVAVAISGNNVVINCTGQASHTISWTGNVSILQAL